MNGLKHTTQRTIAIAATLSTIASTAYAQQGRQSQTDPRSAWKPVYVQSVAAPEIRGRLLDLGSDTLSILADGVRRDIPFNDVLRIDVAGDSVKNGAVIGAIVLGAWCAYICTQGLDDPNQVFVATVVNAGFGALIGAGIDAAHPGRTAIYRKTTTQMPTRSIGLSLAVGF